MHPAAGQRRDNAATRLRSIEPRLCATILALDSRARALRAPINGAHLALLTSTEFRGASDGNHRSHPLRR